MTRRWRVLLDADQTLVNTNNDAGHSAAADFLKKRIVGFCPQEFCERMRNDLRLLFFSTTETEKPLARNLRAAIRVTLLGTVVQQDRPVYPESSRYAHFRYLSLQGMGLALMVDRPSKLFVRAETEFWQAVTENSSLYPDACPVLPFLFEHTEVSIVTASDTRTVLGDDGALVYSRQASAALKRHRVLRAVQRTTPQLGVDDVVVAEIQSKTDASFWNTEFGASERMRTVVVDDSAANLAAAVAIADTRIHLNRSGRSSHLPVGVTHQVSSLEEVPRILGL